MNKVKKIEADAERWAKENPGAAGRVDRIASLSLKIDSRQRLVLQRLLDGPLATSKIKRASGVSFRDLELLGLMEYDGDEWNLTEDGIAVASSNLTE